MRFMNSLLEFLAAPFKVLMFSSAYMSTWIDGKIIMIAVEADEDS